MKSLKAEIERENKLKKRLEEERQTEDIVDFQISIECEKDHAIEIDQNVDDQIEEMMKLKSKNGNCDFQSKDFVSKNANLWKEVALSEVKELKLIDRRSLFPSHLLCNSARKDKSDCKSNLSYTFWFYKMFLNLEIFLLDKFSKQNLVLFCLVY